MELEYKPDFEEARKRWDAFWEGEVLGRPSLWITAPKEGVEPAPPPRQLDGLRMGVREVAEIYDACAASQVYMAEAIPYWRPGFGPDTFAGLLGSELVDSDDSGDTNWAEPFVDDWAEAMPLGIDEEGALWQRLMDLVRAFAEVGKGKWLVGQMDIHSNVDGLSAIRNPQRLCMDLAERPETIDRAMEQVRPLFAKVYDAVFETGNMETYGSVGWAPFYSRGKYCTLQCDFVCMISPAMSRRFVIPALEEETAHVDHSVYHYDGPDALVHLDDIAGLPDLDVIQWTQGAGNGCHVDWIDLLKRIQSKGKGLQVVATPDQAKVLHRELRPEKTHYYVQGVKSVQEGEDLIRWFEDNT